MQKVPQQTQTVELFHLDFLHEFTLWYCSVPFNAAAAAAALYKQKSKGAKKLSEGM